MPSESMAPTFKVGERFLIWRPGGDPNVGDIVVFNPTGRIGLRGVWRDRPQLGCREA